MLEGAHLPFRADLKGISAIFGSALAVALLATPIVRRIAWKIGMLARPNPLVKSHVSATAYLGGVAVYVAFAFAVVAFAASTQTLQFVGLIGLMVGLGALDDRKAFTPRAKLCGQIVISAIAIAILRQPQWPLYLYPAILFWLLLCSNALNLVDVMDGLATGLACCAFAGLSVMALLSGFGEMASVSIALTGAALGFLPFNWNRASIFLGDAGSLALGFAAGLAPLLEPKFILTWQSWIVSFMVVAIPIFEVAFLFVVRTRAGKPFWRGSKDHFALRLQHIGWPIPRIVARSCAVASALIMVTLFVHPTGANHLIALSALAAIGLLGAAGTALARIRM